ncbi:MAG: hypothetical protein QW666_00875 [Candidatus Woesearchaeota archaeon]
MKEVIKMAFMDIFKKKKEAPPETISYERTEEPAGLPIEQVDFMKSQGMSNEEIISSLQAQGYTPKQIYNAIAQIEAGPPATPTGPGAPPPTPMIPEEFPAEAKPVKTSGFEEIAESIVEEKWNELTKELTKFSEWKEITNSRLDKIEQSLIDLKSDIDNLHKAIVSKIGEYDKNLLDVGTEIKAMEKVFQKVLPELTSSVQELGRITKTVKTAKK